MQDQPPNPWKKRLSALGAALVVGYSSHYLTSVLLVAADEAGSGVGNAFMPVLFGVQCLIVVIALIWQLKIADRLRNYETAAFCSAIFLLAAVLALILIAVATASGDSSIDHGASVAAFFMVVIFGGFYAIQAIVFAVIGFALRKRRLSAFGRLA